MYRFSTITIKISPANFVDIDKLILKVFLELQKIHTSQHSPEQRTDTPRLGLTAKLRCHEGVAMVGGARANDQNRTQKETHTDMSTDVTQRSREFSGERTVSSTNVLKCLDTCM